ncbi:Oidioi.mRNA.OKI2018_I69.XSR.g15837.t1.cds [Oikopleura dioica]|uniref:Oidioi.mRNA.OKI2018_I69.XSR.g15837.t1.cds n=1 Tax=Oikopleura dioica TaxID=34765 RepID=A0ABN7SIC4_OIKDI|nr:Oidioi.mRNA.OKI2018_I69.XSR.g15837.t1.cds [Oikopleura dioica]
MDEIDKLEQRIADLEKNQLRLDGLERGRLIQDEEVYNLTQRMNRLEETLFGKTNTLQNKAHNQSKQNISQQNVQIIAQPAVRPRRTSQKVKLIVAGGLFQNGYKDGKPQWDWRDDSLTLNYSGNKITMESQKLMSSRHSQMCGVLYEDHFHIIGGNTEKGPTGDHLRYHHGGWIRDVGLSRARYGAFCGVFRGRIWTCTGSSLDNNGEKVLYKSCDSWAQGDTHWVAGTALYAASAVTPTGLFLIGGNVESLDDPDTVHFMHITKQPADFWHRGPEPEINRGIASATAVVLDIDIYLVGGYDQVTKEIKREIMMLEHNHVPIKSKWKVVGHLNYPRHGLNALPVARTKFAVIGGHSNSTELPFISVFDASNPSSISNSNTSIRVRSSAAAACPTRFFAAAARIPSHKSAP